MTTILVRDGGQLSWKQEGFPRLDGSYLIDVEGEGEGANLRIIRSTEGVCSGLAFELPAPGGQAMKSSLEMAVLAAMQCAETHAEMIEVGMSHPATPGISIIDGGLMTPISDAIEVKDIEQMADEIMMLRAQQVWLNSLGPVTMPGRDVALCRTASEDANRVLGTSLPVCAEIALIVEVSRDPSGRVRFLEPKGAIACAGAASHWTLEGEVAAPDHDIASFVKAMVDQDSRGLRKPS